jgi:hypothetical protein
MSHMQFVHLGLLTFLVAGFGFGTMVARAASVVNLTHYVAEGRHLAQEVAGKVSMCRWYTLLKSRNMLVV